MYHFRDHFESLFKIYGDTIAINLINKTGYEKPLGDEFQKQVNLMRDDRLKYIHFDFHKECRQMQWFLLLTRNRISVLIKQIENDLQTQGYFVRKEKQIFQTQKSVVRTNCIDCLDRTNVVQSVLAQKALESQLKDLNVLRNDESLLDIPEFYHLFKNIWADHADAISNQYSGTGALKTDFTRTGVRSTYGILNDLSNSMMRYFKNHYMDGFRQDAYDLILGIYQVTPSGFSPFESKVSSDLVKVLAFALLTAYFFIKALFSKGNINLIQ
jgi:hypothetical protein